MPCKAQEQTGKQFGQVVAGGVQREATDRSAQLKLAGHVDFHLDLAIEMLEPVGYLATIRQFTHGVLIRQLTHDVLARQPCMQPGENCHGETRCRKSATRSCHTQTGRARARLHPLMPTNLFRSNSVRIPINNIYILTCHYYTPLADHGVGARQKG
jgi:hypothetical protein